MSSYFSAIIIKANEALATATNTISDFVLDNPTTTSVLAGSSAIGTYFFTHTALYQRHQTIIRSIAALGAIGMGYVGYSKIKPMLAHLYRAKQLLENSNTQRMTLSADDLHAIDQTNIQSWVVTLDALRSTTIDTYNVEVLLSAINIVRDKQRLVGGTSHDQIFPLFNHYRINVCSRTVSTIILSSVVRYFNAISVGVTYRYSQMDRELLTKLSLNQEQMTFMEKFEQKRALLNRQQLQMAEPVTPITESTHASTISPLEQQQYNELLHKYNTAEQSKILSDILRGAITDVLNLIYQSTLTVLFPVICQIATTHVMNTDVPLVFSKNRILSQSAKTGPSITDKIMFDQETWIGAQITTADMMLLLERAAVKTFLTLLQPAEWFLKYSLPSAKPTVVPVSDYLLGFGYGNYVNTALRDNKTANSSTEFAITTLNEVDDLKRYALELLDNVKHPKYSELSTQIKSKYPNLPNIAFKDPQMVPAVTAFQPQAPHIHPINFHSNVADNYDHDTSLTKKTDPLPLLSHILLPLGPLLHSLLSRLNQFDDCPLKITPSALGMVPAEANPAHLNLTSRFTNPTTGVRGVGGPSTALFSNTQQYLAGFTNPEQQQQQQQVPHDNTADHTFTLDVKEIYTRRVLQVVGELHSLLLCPDIKFGFEQELDCFAKNLDPAYDPTNNNDTTSNDVDNMDFSLHPWHYVPQISENFSKSQLNRIKQPKSLPNLSETLLTAAFTSQTPISVDHTCGDELDSFFNTSETARVEKTCETYDFDHDGLIYTLEGHSKQYAVVHEMWKDCKVLLGHVGHLLLESNANNSKLPLNNPTAKHIDQPASALVVTKRLSQIFDTLLPSIETAKQYQHSRMQPQGNQQVSQHYLLTPHSFAFSVTILNPHRKYVLDNIMKTITCKVGSEKSEKNDFLDMLGFGGEDVDILSSFLGGSEEPGTGGTIADAFGAGGPGGDNELIKLLSGMSGMGSNDPNADQLMQMMAADMGNTSGFPQGANFLEMLLGNTSASKKKRTKAGAKKTVTTTKKTSRVKNEAEMTPVPPQQREQPRATSTTTENIDDPN